MADKRLDLQALLEAVELERGAGRRIVFTNGCFDVLHTGHMRSLEQAAALGDRLIVGINHDASVRELKGSERPVVAFDQRADLVAAMEAVDWVIGFDEPTPLRLIEAIRPDVLVKGGDWEPDSIVGRQAVERSGGQVVSLPLVRGRSTTGLLERIRSGRRARPEHPE